MNFLARIKKLREKFFDLNIEAMLVTNPVNVSYLSGFTGEDSYLFITYRDAFFITDPRFTTQAKGEIPDNFDIHSSRWGASNALLEFLGNFDIKNIGIEEDALFLSNFQKLSKTLPEKKFINTNMVIAHMRMIKDKDEMALIKNAISISEKAMTESMKDISPGMTERDISAKFAYKLRIYGGDKESFDTIIGSAYRGALPHGIATSKKIEQGDVIVIDFGVIARGYNSDMTRTLKIGTPSHEEEEVYNTVKQAQKRALEMIKPGIKISSLDKVARDYIMSKGYGKFYNHSLGHGVGMEVHELPRVSALSQEVLKEGMIVTIEPGIYLPGKFGVRIEDMVLITKDGKEILSSMDKNFII